jgi:PAS domain S-box-containing protein
VKADALYRELFASSPDGILLIDAETQRVIEFNDAACGQLGYTREEFTGFSISDYDVAQSPDEISGYVQRALREGKIEFDTLQRAKLGEIKNVHVWAKTFRLDGRRVFHAIFRDITERTRVQQALQESERLLKESQVIAGLGSYMLDIPNRRWSSSVVLDGIFGIDDQFDRSIDGWLSLVRPEWRERMNRYLAEEVIGQHRRFDMEYPIIRKSDGHARWVHGLGEVEYDADNSPIRLIGTISDITERREAATTLRLQAAALYAAADAIVVTDLAGIIEWVNPAFAELTGYTAEEAFGKNPRDLVKSDKHPPAFYQELWQTILAGRTWHGEMINRRKDGSLYTEDQSVTPILDASGAITHFVAVKRDITERVQLEAQYRQAQKMESVGQLASGIAHDFNNLLTVINGMSELLMGQIKQDDPAHAGVEEIHRAGERAAGLTRQLLAFSRQQILEPRVLNLSTVVAGMEGLLRRLLGEDITLVVVPTQDEGSVTADPGQIEQVIANLAVNAGDAMPQGGQLTIEAQNVTLGADYAEQHGADVPPGQYVVLSVSDSGVGMDAATCARIFEPFFTTKEPGKGTGLGLSTVYGIVKQSGGFVWVYSEVGVGSNFKIYLPQVIEPVSTKPPTPAVVSTHGTETILLVEDSAELRHVALRFLTPSGYTMLLAATGEEALRLLEQHEGPVHLLVTDVVMPGMSGRQLAERLAQTHPEIKVLFMSGYTGDTIVRHGVLQGKVPFLNKPFTAAALLRKVREVLDSRA